MKMLIAPDKFKGSLSAKQVCAAIAAGLNKSDTHHELMTHPLADGGEGSLEILASHLALHQRTLIVQDPLGRNIEATYYHAERKAYIEVAAASGLLLLKNEERNPLHTSTFGTGQLIRHAIEHSFRNVYLFLGGSATHDGGLGIAAALGYNFYDAAHNRLQPKGANLDQIATFSKEQLINLEGVAFHLITDVQNPLLGPTGAAQVYAPQKGASLATVKILEAGMQNIAALVTKNYPFKREKALVSIPGSGAAGGIGLAMIGFFNASISSGIQTIMAWTDFEKKVQSADLVISGEGKIDLQSLQGKVIHGVASLCKKHQKPLALFVGKNELDVETSQKLSPFTIQEIISLAPDEKDAMQFASKYLTQLAVDFEKNNF